MIRKVELEDIRAIQSLNKVALNYAFPVENALEMLEKNSGRSATDPFRCSRR